MDKINLVEFIDFNLKRASKLKPDVPTHLRVCRYMVFVNLFYV